VLTSPIANRPVLLSLIINGFGETRFSQILVKFQEFPIIWFLSKVSWKSILPKRISGVSEKDGEFY
jgi:hypothetical protein